MRPPVDAATQAQVSSSYGKLPLSFEINRGQTDSQVKFLARGEGYGLFLTPREAVLSLRAAQAQTAQTKARKPATGKEAKADERARFAVVRMRLAHANSSPELSGLDPVPGTSNYFIGNDPGKWQQEIAHYARVKYAAVYPGIDLVYYGNQRQLEYDFVLAPGADSKRIELVFEGARRLSLDKQGNLILATAGGELVQHKPVVYQEAQGKRTEVEGRYVLRGGNRAGFRVASYDARRPLVIDPVLSYSTYLGGSGDDHGYGIAVDASGNAYVTGYTASSNFPTTAGAYQSVYVGGSDAFVTKLNATGTAVVYSTYLGGSSDDAGGRMALDSSGNVYVTGYTTSSNFPTTAGAYQTVYGGGSDAFVTKLNATGSALVYSTFLGGSGEDSGYGVAVDASGYAYVTGYTASSNFPTTVAAYQTVFGGGSDAFVTKLNATGTALDYSTFLGGGGQDSGYGIALDGSGNFYVTGYTTSSNFPTNAGAYQTVYGGSYDAFVTKLNATGSARVYSTYLGGSGVDFGYAIAVDGDGNAYVAGRTASSNFPTTTDAYQAVHAGVDDAFVTKLNATGTALVYSTYLGGNSFDFGYAIAVDGSGNAYVTGSTASSNFPTTTDAYQVVHAGGDDAFMTKLNTTGTVLVYSTYLGGSGGDYGNAIALDGGGNAYVSGFTTSSTFPTTTGAYQPVYGGSNDLFVAKFSGLGTPPQCTLTASPNTITLGGSATLTATCSPEATSYAWTPAAGLVAGPSNTATVEPTATGVYQYSVTGSNGGGAGNTASTSVTVTCTYSLPASQSVTASATTGALSVTAASGCAWTANSNVEWITITSGSSSSGNGTVAYAVAANPGSSSRLGTLTVASQTFTVTQAGITVPICTLTASLSTISAGASATLTATCSPAATSYAWTNTGFDATASAGSVSPTVTTTYSVIGSNAAGSGNTASATVTVTCTYLLSPTSKSVVASATTGTLSVTAASGCAWTASSNVEWITITSGSSSSGNGTVAYAVAANPGSSSRIGTLTVAGQTFTVIQAGLAVPSCTLTASPSTITVGASATLTATCSPAATSYAWINTGFAATISAGTVSPTVTTIYSVVGGNAAGNGNTASATVTVICTYSLLPTSQSVTASATTGALSVTAASGCAWTASSNVEWITITSGGGSSGNGTVAYAVAANPGSGSRIGIVTVAGQTFSVTQAGITVPICTLTASLSTITAGGSATLTATCSPVATSYAWTNTGFSATASAGSVSPTVTTTYSVIGGNAAGSGNTASATVTVTVPAFISQSDCLFNWAEVNFPSLFAPAGAISNTLAPYYYRYYRQTNAYLGTSPTDNHVYYIGSLSNNSLFDVGALSPLLSTAGCQ